MLHTVIVVHYARLEYEHSCSYLSAGISDTKKGGKMRYYTIPALCLFLFMVTPNIEAQAYHLQKKIITTNNVVSLDLFIPELPELKNYTITVHKSQFFENSSLARLVREMTGRDLTLLGQGSDLLLIEQWDTQQSLQSRTDQAFPQWVIDWAGFIFPHESFHIRTMQGKIQQSSLEMVMDVVYKDVSGMTEARFIIKLPVSPAPPTTLQSDDMYASEVQGHTALVVYRKNNLLLHMQAPILRYLGQHRYLVQNPHSGKVFEVQLKTQGENQ